MEPRQKVQKTGARQIGQGPALNSLATWASIQRGRVSPKSNFWPVLEGGSIIRRFFFFLLPPPGFPAAPQNPEKKKRKKEKSGE
jgi:hypothetical protein